MYSYIIGQVKEITTSGITIENNGIGYFINVSNPHAFKYDEAAKIFLFQQIREDEHSLYGFKSIEEKEMFLKLISVKGLGCKMALPFLATNNADDIALAIDREDINYLKKFPKIGDKVARQIILDLKGKLAPTSNKKGNSELIETLKALGYKAANIDKIIGKINNEKSIEEQVKEALKLLLK